MDNESERLPFSQIAGKVLDFLFIVVPIVWTVLVISVFALAIAVEFLPDLLLPACAGSFSIFVIVRWVNFRHRSRSAKLPADDP